MASSVIDLSCKLNNDCCFTGKQCCHYTCGRFLIPCLKSCQRFIEVCRGNWAFYHLLVAIAICNCVVSILTAVKIGEEWQGFDYARNTEILGKNLSIAIAFLGCMAQVCAIIGMVTLKRICFWVLEALELLLVCLAFVLVWDGFSNVDGTLEKVHAFYDDLKQNNIQLSFEKNITCCGWDSPEVRCLEISSRTCESLVTEQVKHVLSFTGTWARWLIVINTLELFFTFLMTSHFRTFDWKAVSNNTTDQIFELDD